MKGELKNKKDRVVTEAYFDKKLDEKLDEKLANFVTKDYLDEKLEDFVTKDYLSEQLGEFRADLKDELREDMRTQTVEILQRVDKIVSRFDTLTKDNAAHTSLHKRIDDKLLHHENRIKKLEARI